MNEPKIWFQEPSQNDPTYKNNTETTFHWLARSTTERAVKCRALLNSNLAKLPGNMQEHLFHELKHRWNSAFFEIIVARTLQELGGGIEYEVPLSTGKQPDFLVTFPSGKIIVEATVPEINKAANQEYEDAQPLLEIIEEHKPDGWHIIAWEVPAIGPNDSKVQFKAIIKELFQGLDMTSVESPMDVHKKLPEGDLSMTLFPSSNGPGDVTGPAISYMDDTETRIRKSLRRKRKQVQNSQWPVILAIGCEDAQLEHFDKALIGSTAGYMDLSYTEVARAFLLTGEWTRRKPGFDPPTVDGLLAFCRFGFPTTPAPTFYLHPRSTARLPTSFSWLSQRYYGIGKVQSQGTNLMAGVNCVQFRGYS